MRRWEIRKEADKSIPEHQWHVVPADCILDSSRRPSHEPLLQSHLIHETSDGTKLNVVQKLQTLISGPKSTHFSLLIFFLPNLADSSSIELCVTGPSFLGPLHLPRCSLDCCSLLPSSAFPVGFSSCQSYSQTCRGLFIPCSEDHFFLTLKSKAFHHLFPFQDPSYLHSFALICLKTRAQARANLLPSTFACAVQFAQRTLLSHLPSNTHSVFENSAQILPAESFLDVRYFSI